MAWVALWFVVGVVLFGITAHSRRSTTAKARAANAPAPPWDWKEAGAAVAAAVTLVGALNTLTANLQSKKATDVAAANATRDSVQRELVAVRDSVRRLAHFELRTWERLPRLTVDPTTTGDVRADDRSVVGPCVRKGGTSSYAATGPARLRCGKDSDLRIRLGGATVVLLLPDTAAR